MRAHIIVVCLLITLAFQENQASQEKTAKQREAIHTICSQLSNKVEEIRLKTKQLTDQMNVALMAGQVDYKDAFKPQSKKIIKLSSQIEEITKMTQRVYDNKNYVKLCLVLDEQLSYGKLTSGDLQKDLQDLKILRENLQTNSGNSKDSTQEL